jgi:hypothetical protein
MLVRYLLDIDRRVETQRADKRASLALGGA